MMVALFLSRFPFLQQGVEKGLTAIVTGLYFNTLDLKTAAFLQLLSLLGETRVRAQAVESHLSTAC